MQTEVDEMLSIYTGSHLARLEHRLHCFSERRTSAWCATSGEQPHWIGAPRIEKKIESPSLEIPDPAMVEIAENMPRNIAHYETHGPVVDSSLAIADHPTDRITELSRSHSRSLNLWQIDDTPSK